MCIICAKEGRNLSHGAPRSAGETRKVGLDTRTRDQKWPEDSFFELVFRVRSLNHSMEPKEMILKNRFNSGSCNFV